MLRQMHGEITHQDIDRRRRGTPEHLRQHAEDRDRKHESGAKRQAGIDQPQSPPKVTNHRQGTDDISQGRGHREAERAHWSARALSNSCSLVLSDGSSRTWSSNAARVCPMRGPLAPRDCRSFPLIARSDRVSGSPRRRISRTAGNHGGSLPRRSDHKDERSSADAPTAESHLRIEGSSVPAGSSGPRSIPSARSISTLEALSRRRTEAGGAGGKAGRKKRNGRPHRGGG